MREFPEGDACASPFFYRASRFAIWVLVAAILAPRRSGSEGVEEREQGAVSRSEEAGSGDKASPQGMGSEFSFQFDFRISV